MRKAGYWFAGLLGLLSLAVMAQENKQLTLEDLIPGGETFYKFRPENIPGIQWWGNSLAYYDTGDSVLVVKQAKNPAKSSFISLKTVNEALESAGLPGQATLYSVSFPQETNGMLIRAPKYYALYDDGRITWKITPDSIRSNNDFCPQNRTLALPFDVLALHLSIFQFQGHIDIRQYNSIAGRIDNQHRISGYIHHLLTFAGMIVPH